MLIMFSDPAIGASLMTMVHPGAHSDPYATLMFFILPRDDRTETMSDAELNKLSYLDFEGLRKACAKAHSFIQGQEA